MGHKVFFLLTSVGQMLIVVLLLVVVAGLFVVSDAVPVGG